MMTFFYSWLIVAVVCLIIELSTGAVALVFFSVAAGILAVLNLLLSLELSHQLFIFAVLGILGLAFLRKRLMKTLHRDRTAHNKVGDTEYSVIIPRDLEPGEQVRLPYQGSLFTAVNASDQVLKAQTRAKIVRTEGIHLYVTAF